jgi:hypothetical protein
MCGRCASFLPVEAGPDLRHNEPAPEPGTVLERRAEAGRGVIRRHPDTSTY